MIESAVVAAAGSWEDVVRAAGMTIDVNSFGDGYNNTSTVRRLGQQA